MAYANIEAEISDLKRSTHFVSLDFCSGYGKYPLYQNSYDDYGIIEPQATYLANPVLHGLKNAEACFQSTIPLHFNSIDEVVQECFNDFKFMPRQKKPY